MDRVVFQHLALLGVALLAVDALESPERITVLLRRLPSSWAVCPP